MFHRESRGGDVFIATAVTYCSTQVSPMASKTFVTLSTCKDDAGPWFLHLHPAPCLTSNDQGNGVIASIFCTCNRRSWNLPGLFRELRLA